MIPRILCFSGTIGSGKTRVSIEVGRALGWPRVGFGDYVRSLADARGAAHSRESLQRIGEGEICQKGYEHFCRAMLAWAGWNSGHPVVIDGVRHCQVLDALRRLAEPMPVLLVFLLASIEVRSARLVERGDCLGTHAKVASNSTEIQVESLLLGCADLVVDAEQSIDVVVDEVVAWVQGCGDERAFTASANRAAASDRRSVGG